MTLNELLNSDLACVEALARLDESLGTTVKFLYPKDLELLPEGIYTTADRVKRNYRINIDRIRHSHLVPFTFFGAKYLGPTGTYAEVLDEIGILAKGVWLYTPSSVAYSLLCTRQPVGFLFRQQVMADSPLSPLYKLKPQKHKQLYNSVFHARAYTT